MQTSCNPLPRKQLPQFSKISCSIPLCQFLAQYILRTTYSRSQETWAAWMQVGEVWDFDTHWTSEHEHESAHGTPWIQKPRQFCQKINKMLRLYGDISVIVKVLFQCCLHFLIDFLQQSTASMFWCMDSIGTKSPPNSWSFIISGFQATSGPARWVVCRQMKRIKRNKCWSRFWSSRRYC